MPEENKFDKELLEFSKALGGGSRFLLNNAGKAIALITLSVAALLIFTDIAFADLRSSAFTTTLAAMLAASYIIYFSLESSGERLGEQSAEYRSAIEKYKSVRNKISPSDIGALRAFCTRYAEQELEYRRSAYIAESGFTPEEYAAYKQGAPQKKRAMRVFKRAEKMCAVPLSPPLLLSGGVTDPGGELENPERTKILNAFISLIPSTLCMIFTVSIMLTARGDLTASAIIDGLVKLSALPIIGFRGYTSGYSYITEKKALWVETKTGLLQAFISLKCS